MEQNRSLIIIISATLFVAALLAVAIWVFYPERDAPMAAEADDDPFTFAGSMTLRPGETGIPDDTDTADTGEEATGTDGISEIAIRFADEVVVPGPDGPTVIPTAGTQAGPDTTGPGASTAQETPAGTGAARADSSGSIASRPASTRRPQTSTPSAPSASGAGAQPAATSIEVTRSEVEYWIQLFSTPNRDRIETAQARLEDLSFGSRVSTRTVEDTLYYRLRVGPYVNLHEAGKFLDWLSVIPDFGGAYISQVRPRRS